MPPFTVSGFPWQGFGDTPQPSIASLTAKVLCTTHNSRLHSLDDACLHLLKCFQEIDDMIDNRRVTGNHSKEVDGDSNREMGLEGPHGLVASGNAAKDDQPVKKSNPPLAWLQLLYGLEPMPAGWGLYLSSRLREAPMRTRSVAFAPLIESSKMVGALCRINGFEFVLAMATLRRTAPGHCLPTRSSVQRTCCSHTALAIARSVSVSAGPLAEGLTVSTWRFTRKTQGPHNTPLQPTSGAGTTG